MLGRVSRLVLGAGADFSRRDGQMAVLFGVHVQAARVVGMGVGGGSGMCCVGALASAGAGGGLVPAVLGRGGGWCRVGVGEGGSRPGEGWYWRYIPILVVRLGVVGRVLGDDGKVAAGHGDLVVAGCLDAVAGVLVEHLEQGLIGIVVEVVDFVAAGQQVGHGCGRRLVDDGGRDNVGDVAEVVLGWDAQARVRVEAAKGGQVHVTAQDGAPHRELGAHAL